MDMTLGYALNESQEMALYMEIEDEMDDIKEVLAEQWLQHDQPLAGGYGQNVVHWRGNQAVTLFKDHKAMIRTIAESTSIRSNGHAWCTADDSQCIGNGGLDATRCSSCNNAVIGRQHARLYQRLYDDLMDVQKCDDIDQAGLARVQRDLGRCRTVLMSLGYDPETPVREAVCAKSASPKMPVKGNCSSPCCESSEGGGRTKATKLSIAAVAREAGVSAALIHNPYPAVAEAIRSAQGRSSREQREAKHEELKATREKNRELRGALEVALSQRDKLASINDVLLCVFR